MSLTNLLEPTMCSRIGALTWGQLVYVSDKPVRTVGWSGTEIQNRLTNQLICKPPCDFSPAHANRLPNNSYNPAHIIPHPDHFILYLRPKAVRPYQQSWISFFTVAVSLHTDTAIYPGPDPPPRSAIILSGTGFACVGRYGAGNGSFSALLQDTVTRRNSPRSNIFTLMQSDYSSYLEITCHQMCSEPWEYAINLSRHVSFSVNLAASDSVLRASQRRGPQLCPGPSGRTWRGRGHRPSK